MQIFTTTFDSFGLDIGDRSLKVAYLKPYGTSAQLSSTGSIDVPKGVFDKGALIKPDIFCEYLTKLLDNVAPKKIKTKYVHACLPETHTFIKLLSIDAKSSEEIPALIRDELPRHVPLDINDTYLDWSIVPNQNIDPSKASVLVGVIPKKTSDAYTSSLRNCNLIPVSLQIEAQAILRSVLPYNEPEKKSLAVVDIGATRASFILFDHGSIQFTISVPFASDDMTNRIAQELSLSQTDAEKAKTNIGLDKTKGKGSLLTVLGPMVQELATIFKKNTSFYKEHFAGASPINDIMLCGGGAQLQGLPEMLSELLPNIKITRANPMINAHDAEKHNLNLSYTTAIGLGLTNAFRT